MNWLHHRRLALILAVLVVGVQLSAAQARKPNITILATGGTIAGAAATGTQAGYTSGAVTIDAMIAAVPGIRDLANIKGEQVSNVGSQDMSYDILLKVAKRINELTKSSDVDGITTRNPGSGAGSWSWPAPSKHRRQRLPSRRLRDAVRWGHGPSRHLATAPPFGHIARQHAVLGMWAKHVTLGLRLRTTGSAGRKAPRFRMPACRAHPTSRIKK